MFTTKSALPPVLALFLTLAPVSLPGAEEPAAAPATESAAPSAPAATGSKPAAEPAVNPENHDTDLARQLAATKNKLSTVLRTYSLLEEENDRLKSAAGNREEAAAARSANEQALTEAQTAAEAAEARATKATAQTAALRDALRQTQAQVAALAAENAQLRTRLALAGAPPGSMLAAPSRQAPLPPSSATVTTATADAAAPVVAPAPGPAATPATESSATATADGAARTYVVAPGDNLEKISRQVYGTPDRWNEIFQANRDAIKNPTVLFVGITLRIP
jgi:nucleoid-associated protein YgaU